MAHIPCWPSQSKLSNCIIQWISFSSIVGVKQIPATSRNLSATYETAHPRLRLGFGLPRWLHRLCSLCRYLFDSDYTTSGWLRIDGPVHKYRQTQRNHIGSCAYLRHGQQRRARTMGAVDLSVSLLRSHQLDKQAAFVRKGNGCRHHELNSTTPPWGSGDNSQSISP